MVHPTLLLYLLDRIQNENIIPSTLIDENVSLSDNIRFALNCKNHEEILKSLLTHPPYIKVEEEPFATRFDLLSIQNNKTCFVEFLYYMGALTRVNGNELLFEIPNLVTKTEYLQEIMSASGLILRLDSKHRFELAINELITNKNIEPLCEEIKKHKLSHLKFNDSLHSKEQDVKTGFLFAFSIADQKIKSEFPIPIGDKKFNSLNLYLEEAKIHIQCKNVTLKDLGYPENANWKFLNDVSEEIDNKKREEVMQLSNEKKLDLKNKQQTLDKMFKSKKNPYVQSVWNELINQTWL